MGGMLQDHYASMAAALRFVWQFSILTFVLQHGGGEHKGASEVGLTTSQ